MKWGRVAGIDDGYFERGRDKRAPLVATLMKSAVIEGFRFGWISVDGSDATEGIANLLLDLRPQLSVVFLYGTIFGGSNVVELNRLYSLLNRPVIVIVDDRPHEGAVERALLTHGGEAALKRYRENPPVVRLETRRGALYGTFLGISKGEALKIIGHYQFVGKVPEPLRVSHLIGRAMKGWY